MNKFNLILEEYRVLKQEQLERIKLRDNFVFLSLGIFGAIFSYALFENDSQNKLIVLSIIPSICFICLWLYIVNDEKISQIGQFIRENLKAKLEILLEEENSNIFFEWETYHRSDNKRFLRKFIQVIVDLLAFCVPSIISIVAFIILSESEINIFIKYFNFFVIFCLFILIVYYDYNSPEVRM